MQEISSERSFQLGQQACVFEFLVEFLSEENGLGYWGHFLDLNVYIIFFMRGLWMGKEGRGRGGEGRERGAGGMCGVGCC